MSKLAHLPARAVLAIEGPDRVSFLQGLVSNDVALAAPGRAVWAALLTPQGKYLADFFLFSHGDRLLLDCEAAQAAILATRLSRFRLRAKVTVAETALKVAASWDGAPPDGAGLIVAPDPRLAEAGWRLIGETLPEATADESDYDTHRLLLGLPDGTRDSEPEKTVLLEAGFDELNGVSWSKGCFMGQELTARTRYRGLLKRRLVPVSGDGALPPPGTPLMADGREIGTMRSSREKNGLAVLRLEHLHGAVDTEHGTLQARVPGWMRLPEPKAEAGSDAS
ncbi:folate-binding protein [Acetobacteraceae bacterium KSS8]|uniref:Folate-binding protein n=1 Tax=Endosaccharibacter trunci TaxID=2812733 RepID=A0ABT1W949_9PROT|nr:folate-binding protein [Acetobacteraceae bacterium KSS8]